MGSQIVSLVCASPCESTANDTRPFSRVGARAAADAPAVLDCNFTAPAHDAGVVPVAVSVAFGPWVSQGPSLDVPLFTFLDPAALSMTPHSGPFFRASSARRTYVYVSGPALSGREILAAPLQFYAVLTQLNYSRLPDVQLACVDGRLQYATPFGRSAAGASQDIWWCTAARVCTRAGSNVSVGVTMFRNCSFAGADGWVDSPAEAGALATDPPERTLLSASASITCTLMQRQRLFATLPSASAPRSDFFDATAGQVEVHHLLRPETLSSELGLASSDVVTTLLLLMGSAPKLDMFDFSVAYAAVVPTSSVTIDAALALATTWTDCAAPAFMSVADLRPVCENLLGVPRGQDVAGGCSSSSQVRGPRAGASRALLRSTTGCRNGPRFRSATVFAGTARAPSSCACAAAGSRALRSPARSNRSARRASTPWPSHGMADRLRS